MDRPRPRILYIAPRPPYPLTSGMAIRQFHLLRAYAGYADVDLVFFYREQAQQEAARPLGEYCATIHPVSLATTRGERDLAARPRWQRRLHLTLAPAPASVTLLFSADMASLVERLAASAELVHVARLPMVGHVESLLQRRARPRFILDLDDVETTVKVRQLLSLRRATPARLGVGLPDLFKTWAYQRQALRRFDRVLVCSDRDARRLGAANATVVPNGTTVPPRLPASTSDGRTLLFCGLLSYPPNIDALEFFVGSVLPRIRREIPDARLLIVGRAPGPRVRALEDGRAISVEANVPSVSEYYQRATVAVVPLRIAGGTRIKILEAWALGVPVVSTTVGCEGLEATDGKQLLKADRPDDFARACVRLLKSPALRRHLVERGRDLVWRAYRWDAIGSGLVALARQLVDEVPDGHRARRAPIGSGRP